MEKIYLQIPEDFIAHSDVICELDNMVKLYNAMPKKQFMARWNYFWECHSAICKMHADGKICIYDSECDFEYLHTLIENDGPEYTAIVNFYASNMDLYKIGVCVRGAPMLRKVSSGIAGRKNRLRWWQRLLLN